MAQETLVVYLIVVAVGMIVAVAIYRWVKTRSVARTPGASALSNTANTAHPHDLRGTMTRWHH
ncbi:MAG: hypothetical protein ABIR94_00105 [Rubrivivax sp.]